MRRWQMENGGTFNIGVGYVLTGHNRHEKQIAKDTIGKLVDDLVFREEDNQGGNMNKANLPQLTKSAPCPMVFNRVHVSHEGYFTLCCVDYQNHLAVADLNEVSLEEAWRSELAVEMRRRHLTSDLAGTVCHNCISGKGTQVTPLVERFATMLDCHCSSRSGC